MSGMTAEQLLDQVRNQSLDEWTAEYEAVDANTSPGAIYRRLSTVQQKPVEWLWSGRIPKGKMVTIAGVPGLGKSQLTISLGAILTAGGELPVTRERCKPGSVVFWSSEDSAEDTIGPRCTAAGADMDKVYVFDAVRDTKGDSLVEREFNLAEHIDQLSQMIRQIGDVVLVVLDPVSGCMGKTDSHNNSDVRAVLARLMSLADELGFTVLLVTHLNKGGGGGDAMSRFMGSTAFVAAARAAYLIAKDPEDETRRIFMPVKNNLGVDDSGFAFRVESVTLDNGIDTSRIVWDDQLVTRDVNELVSPPKQDDEHRGEAITEAINFLREEMQENRTIPTKELKASANAAGINFSTLKRAKTELGIQAKKTKGEHGCWNWHWPQRGSHAPLP